MEKLNANRRWWVLAVVVAAQFMFVVDAFVANVAIPTIRTELKATAGEMAAVIAIYQIAYATTVITGGRLGDIYGRRAVFMAGVCCFTLASLWCGLADSGPALVLARLAQGGAAALMVPQVLATIHVLFPDGARSRAFAVFGLALGLGGAVGFAAGGVLVTLSPAGLGWRSVFLVNLPIGVAILLAGYRLMPVVPRRPGVRLDLPGALLLFVALSALIVPIMAGHDLGWPLWLWDVMFAGVAALPLFLLLERRIGRRGGMPLIALTLLADTAFRRGLATLFAFQFGNIAFYLAVTIFLQGQLGFSPMRAGLAAAPLALAFVVASQLTARWQARYGIGVLRAGAGIQLVGIGALAMLAGLPAAPGPVPVAAVLSIFGFGQGLVMAPLSGLVLATVRPSEAGSGVGVLNTVQQAAGAVGVSLIGMLCFQGDIFAALGVLAVSCVATIGGLRSMEAARSGAQPAE